MVVKRVRFLKEIQAVVLMCVCVLAALHCWLNRPVKWAFGSRTSAATAGERLRFLQGMFNRTKRFHFPSFTVQGAHHVVEGWLGNQAAFVTQALASEQSRQQVCGSIAEIGVHHGLFTSALIEVALINEPVFVIDVFDRQQDNIDRSGRGNFHSFNVTLSHFGWKAVLVESPATGAIPIWVPRTVTAIRAKSNEVSIGMLRSYFPPLRIMSVDGGHYVDAVVNDLTMAAALLVDGGLIIVDDYTNMLEWPGVREGVAQYFYSRSDKRLAPFAIIANKLFITTASHHEKYFAWLKHLPELNNCLGGHSGGGARDDARFKVFGWKFLYFHPNAPGCRITLSSWHSMLNRWDSASSPKF